MRFFVSLLFLVALLSVSGCDDPSSDDVPDVTNQYNLGVMYYNGQGVPQDYKEAMKWFRMAAEQGHADAQYNLGVIYSNGKGVPQDHKEAMKWLRMAAEH